jgi:hypothetical protein
MPRSFPIPRRRRLEVRQLAAAFMPHLLDIEWINRAFKESASLLAHFKGFASGKNALSETPALPAAPGARTMLRWGARPAFSANIPGAALSEAEQEQIWLPIMMTDCEHNW